MNIVKTWRSTNMTYRRETSRHWIRVLMLQRVEELRKMLNNKSCDLRLSSKKITRTSCGTEEQSQQVPWSSQFLTDGIQGGRPADPPIAHIHVYVKTVCMCVCFFDDEVWKYGYYITFAHVIAPGFMNISWIFQKLLEWTYTRADMWHIKASVTTK
jgi:hypothetical protein